MAVTVTTGSLKKLYTPFTGLSATERSRSGIARAELVYYNVNDSWGTPGVGNQRLYQTGILDLPKDFGYVLTDAFCKVQASGNLNLSASSLLTLYPGGILGPQINVTLDASPDRQDSSGSTAIGSIPANRYNTVKPIDSSNDGVMVFNLTNKPTSVLYPFNSSAYTTASNPASSWSWVLGEEIEGSGNAYDVSCYFRFLQYDIDQSYNYPIQSPQLTR